MYKIHNSYVHTTFQLAISLGKGTKLKHSFKLLLTLVAQLGLMKGMKKLIKYDFFFSITLYMYTQHLIIYCNFKIHLRDLISFTPTPILCIKMDKQLSIGINRTQTRAAQLVSVNDHESTYKKLSDVNFMSLHAFAPCHHVWCL